MSVPSNSTARTTMIATGTVGGFFSGLVGGGGGAVMIPLMTGVLKMRQHTAHGTSLVIIFVTAVATATTYALNGDVDWPLVAMLLGGSTIGAVLGARAARNVPAMRLRQFLGVFITLVALRLLLFRDVDPLLSVSGVAEAAVGAAIGLAGGLSAGALGVGGGAIFVPALVLLIGTPQHEAQGISLCVIVFTAAAGALTHRRQGTVDTRAARWIAPVSVPAGVFGALAAAQVSDRGLRVIVSTVLIGIGTQMVWTATRTLRRPPVVVHDSHAAVTTV
ncbi:MAG: sulfite exporter TauE/SafE family protein [Chloroflexi bacterium]|nr:sulfite exporter TauE/SafE family protein [Chloroflexota bacterium]